MYRRTMIVMLYCLHIVLSAFVSYDRAKELRMTKNEIMGKTLSYQELIEAIEQFKRAHPQLEDAMRIFNLSNDQYQAALAALYGPRISWSNSTNDTVTRSL